MDQQDKSAPRWTPGPWYLRLSDNATPHIEHGDCLFDEVGELRNRICVMPAEITQSYNSLANGRLIAAAPELFEALKFFVEHPGVWQLCTPNSEAMSAARAAFAKALGSQQ